MAKPQVEQIPHFVIENGRKNLSQSSVSELISVMNRLSRVVGEDKAMALNNIGVIQSYLNDHESALETFEDSISSSFSDAAFSNKLHSLKALDQLEKSIALGFDFLERFPNNKKVFRYIYNNTKKLCMENEFKKLEKFYKYFETEQDFIESISKNDAVYNRRAKYLKESGVDLRFFSIYLNAGYAVLAKLVTGDVKTTISENDSTNSFTIKLSADLSKNDIRFLNRDFDKRIENLINTGLITFEDYLHHMNKINLGFSIYKNVLEAEI